MSTALPNWSFWLWREAAWILPVAPAAHAPFPRPLAARPHRVILVLSSLPHEFDAPVLRTPVGRIVRRHRLIRAKSGRGEPRGIHAELRDQHRLYRFAAPP